MLSEEFNLKCPVCGTDYVHPTANHTVPASKDGTGAVVVTAAGIITVDKAKPADGSRGVRVQLHFYCEEEHFFHVYYQFHKGMTYWGFVEDPKNEAGVIWRD